MTDDQKKANTEHDYRLTKNIVKEALQIQSSSWLRKIALALVVEKQVSLDRSHTGEPMPWSGFIKIRHVKEYVLSVLIVCFTVTAAAAIADVMVDPKDVSYVYLLGFAPPLVIFGYLMRLKTMDVIQMKIPGSLLFMGKHLGERVTCKEVREYLALIDRKETDDLTAIDYLKVAAHLLDVDEQKEKERLDKNFVTRFIENDAPNRLEQA